MCIPLKRKNELIPTESNNKNLPFGFPDGSGRFEKGIDGRGNPYGKRTYDNGDFIKQEVLHSGELKLTAKKKIK